MKDNISTCWKVDREHNQFVHYRKHGGNLEIVRLDCGLRKAGHKCGGGIYSLDLKGTVHEKKGFALCGKCAAEARP